MHDHVLIVLAGIGALAILCQWIAWWLKLPAILFLLLAGVIAGPATSWLDPDKLFGDLLFPFVSLGVAVILFEGSMTLKFAEIRGLEQVVRRFVTSGVLLTWTIISLATHWLLALSWEVSFLFGAVMVVTGPTVIIPMLRTVRPTAHIANILRWEGIVVDPIGALLAVLVFDFIVSGQGGAALGHSLLNFAQMIVTGLLAGAAGAYLLGLIMKRHWLPEFLHNVAALTFVFFIFTLSSIIKEESGLLAVTVMGMWLGNMKDVHTRDILDFKESLSILIISGLFIILAARLEFADFQQIGWWGLVLFLFIQFVVRPVKVLASTWGSSLKWQEKVLLAWIAPRGIIAAAVIALFAIRLQQIGYDEAGVLIPLAFTVIIGTVVLQSATAGWLARWLGVAEPEPKGFLIIGANAVARAIAQVLVKKGFRALLTDVSWDNVRQARMAGLQVFYGNAVSAHADRHLDFVGIGRMLALSPQYVVNALACMRYAGEFGRNNVYSLPAGKEKAELDDEQAPGLRGGLVAFGREVSFTRLSSLLGQGAEVTETGLTEQFSFEDYQAKYGTNAIPLLAISPKDRLHVFTEVETFSPGPDWTIIGLVKKEEKNGES